MKMTYEQYKEKAWDDADSDGYVEFNCASCGELATTDTLVTPCHPEGFAEGSGHGGYDWMRIDCQPETGSCSWGGSMQEFEPLLVHSNCLKSPFLTEVEVGVE